MQQLRFKRLRKPASAGLFALAASLGLAGCVALPVQELQSHWPENLPGRALLSQTPFVAQQEFECGPAALAMLMQAAGLKIEAKQLAPQVFVPGRQGSLQVEMLVAARRQGLPAYLLAPKLEAVLQEVAAGHPVLVFQNLSLPVSPVWHYAVLIGYDRERGTVTLHSGTTAAMETSLSAFEHTWARGEHWAMLALAPERLPASADASSAGRAIAALERLQPRSAATAYASALRRWPGDLLLQMGAGNSAYALGDFATAETAYRAASLAHPKSADAWNNLAQVLLEQGKKETAARAIAQAILLGGPRLASYQALALQIKGD